MTINITSSTNYGFDPCLPYGGFGLRSNDHNRSNLEKELQMKREKFEKDLYEKEGELPEEVVEEKWQESQRRERMEFLDRLERGLELKNNNEPSS